MPNARSSFNGVCIDLYTDAIPAFARFGEDPVLYAPTIPQPILQPRQVAFRREDSACSPWANWIGGGETARHRLSRAA